MAYTFLDLQTEVKRRAVKNQGGTQFDTAIKNLINTSLFRIAREAHWRQLRRKATFATEGEYTTGTVTATNGSKTLTFATSTLITQGINIGQRIDIQGSQLPYIIATITSETGATVNLNYDGTTGASKTFTIYGKEEYNLPIQCDRVGLVWHEDFGYPFLLEYMPDREFYESGTNINTGNTPTHYRMWGEDTVIDQPLQASVLRVYSSVDNATDRSIAIQIFGKVGGYPDSESISTDATNSTTAVSGTKSFQTVERIVKAATTTGRITIDANSANTTIAVLPTGDYTGTIQYKKIQLWPLPEDVFNINVQYYKQVYRLVGDNDIHELGQEFDEAIIALAVARLKAENSQEEGKMWFNLYKDELISLKRHNADKLDWLPQLKRPSQSQRRLTLHRNLSFLQLGGQYGPISRP